MNSNQIFKHIHGLS